MNNKTASFQDTTICLVTKISPAYTANIQQISEIPINEFRSFTASKVDPEKPYPNPINKLMGLEKFNFLPR